MFILYGEKYMLQKRINVGLVISLAGFAISVNTLPPLIEWFSGHLRMPISSFGLVYFFQYGAFTLCSIGIESFTPSGGFHSCPSRSERSSFPLFACF